MSAICKEETGGIGADGERLTIPNNIRIINTSGFVIPASTLNRIWTVFSLQIKKRSTQVEGDVDFNFWKYYSKQPISRTTEGTMESFTDAVYGANVGQEFTAGIIPEVVWQKCGYEEDRLNRHPCDGCNFVDLKIWAEGFDNETLSAAHRLSSPNLSTVPYIHIGTTMGQTLWSTDFLFQRMKTHNNNINKQLHEEQSMEAARIWTDSLNILCCDTNLKGEAPIIPSIRHDIRQFVKEYHKFIIQLCLNNDTKECIKAMQVPNHDGGIPKFPNFNLVSKIYRGLEVIPISSAGLTRFYMPHCSQATEQYKKPTKKRRRKAKRKTEKSEETGEGAFPQDEIKETIWETSKVANIFGISTIEDTCDSTVSVIADVENGSKAVADEITKVPNDLELITTGNKYETSKAENILKIITTERTETRVTDAINITNGIITSLIQTPFQVAATPHGTHSPKISRFTTPEERVAPQAGLVQNETISQTTNTSSAGDIKVSVATIAEATADLPVSALAEDVKPHTITTQKGTKEVSHTTTPTHTHPKETRATEAATQDASFTSEARDRVIAQLRAQSPPPSIDEARARRASIKQERRQSIEFIRSRTTSRASANGRPSRYLSLATPPDPPRLPLSVEQTSEAFPDNNVKDKITADISLSLPRSSVEIPKIIGDQTAKDEFTVGHTPTIPVAIEHTYDRHCKGIGGDEFAVVSPRRLSGLLKQSPKPVPDDSVKEELAIYIPSSLPRTLLESPGNLPGHTTKDRHTDDLPHSTQPSLSGTKEIIKEPKRGKWIAPLPKDQDWKNIIHDSQPPVTVAVQSAPKKKNNKRRGVKPGIQSQTRLALPANIETASSLVAVVPTCSTWTQTELVYTPRSVGTQIDLVYTSKSVGTQTEPGNTPSSEAQSIAEDLVPGSGPVPSREDELEGHDTTKPSQSVTSRQTTPSPGELVLSSTVEDYVYGHNRGVERARDRLTMAAPSSSRASLVAELTLAGVPPSALRLFVQTGLEALEATGCPSPVSIRALGAETVTIDGVTYETPRRGSQHRRAASMPEVIDSDAGSEVSGSGGDFDTEVLAGSTSPALDAGNLGSVITNAVATIDPAPVDMDVSQVVSLPETLPCKSPDVSPLVLGSPLVATPVISVLLVPIAATAVVSPVVSNEPELEDMVGSRLFKEPSQDFTTSLPGFLPWNGKDMTSDEVVTSLGSSFPRPLTLEDHPRVNIFLRASHIIACAFCGLATTESFEEGPEWKQSQACPGCGPASEVRYCDVSCLLADVLDHAKVCGTQSPSCPIFWLCMPQRYQKMMPPLRPYGVSVSPECHRQMMYSMLVHDAPARHPYWKWIEVNLSTEEGLEMGRSEDFKVPEVVDEGDYFLFEPFPAADILPDLLPMVYLTIRFTGAERVAFNRTLNVAFYCRLPAAVNFIHRMLFDFVVRSPSDRVSLRRNKIRLSCQLAQEFPEFGDFADPEDVFDFGKEWKGIELLILHFECRHPLLRAWCREDPERQQNGKRKSSVWSRFVGLEWGGVIDPSFVGGYPVPRGILPAGYYGVEPSIYEPELEEEYRGRVLKALAMVGGEETAEGERGETGEVEE